MYKLLLKLTKLMFTLSICLFQDVQGKTGTGKPVLLCVVPISHGNYGSSGRFPPFPQTKNHADFFMDMIFNDEMYFINLHNLMMK